MPLNRRVGMAAAAVVGLAVVIAAVVVYMVVRGQLVGQVDSALNHEAAQVQAQGPRALNNFSAPQLGPRSGGPSQYWQTVSTDGTRENPGLALPVDSRTMAVATGHSGSSFFEDLSADGSEVRVLTLQIQEPGGQPVGALQLADSLAPTDNTLSNLRLILFVLCIGGIALAAILGRLAARRVLAPLGEVAASASYISQTDDLSHRLKVHADDEVGELATRFNAMLDRLETSREALDESARAQRQLVADASHELRTPVTSLRTNIEVLLAGGELDEDDRRRLLADVVEQSEELSALVSDLIDLARGDEPVGEADDVRLDRVVEQSVARARRNAPGIEFQTHLEPVIVEGLPERLERAINNLLDNASRHSSPGGTVEVDVDTDGIRVRDHGSGIDEADLPHVFDRFFRGANVRGQQGSGLGLAIVRQVTEQHGGAVMAANAPDGGAVFTIRLPAVTAEKPPDFEPPSAEPHVAGARP
jgi:two-component system, OmpR family, sensor histidine kinase MprB